MSPTGQDSAHEEAHTGPIKNPKQLLVAVLFSFVVPIFAIIGLVYYVTSAPKPAAGAVDPQKSVAERIQKVGTVEIRDANRALKSGDVVYAAQCVACHGAGVAGAPKFGDAAAWAPRIQTGYEALLNSSLKGKGAMGAQGGGDWDDREIAAAVVHMANAAGASFPLPSAAPAAAASAPAAAAPAAAPAGPAAPAAAPAPNAAAPAVAAPVAVAAAAPAAAAVMKTSANGEATYKGVCMACHAAAVAGAPKLGDKAAWAPRIATGLDAMTNSVLKGKGAMPPKGGSAAPDADIRAAVEYMVNASK